MAAVEGVIPNLINGISQQAPAMRLPSQGAISENYYPLVADGLIKRPPTTHLAATGVSLPEDTFTHFILRDDTEKYVVAIRTNGTIKVWDFAGNEKTVTNNGTAYLSGLTNAKDQLRALTVADYTFIVNRSKTVAAGTATVPARPAGEALVNVQAGAYGKTYRININGVWAATYQTPDGSTSSHSYNVDTVFIANELYTDLVAAGLNTAPWAVGRYHSAIYIRNETYDFTMSTEDGYSGRNMKDVKGKVQKFSDLPLYGPDGVVLEITGTDDSQFDNYFVEFQKDNDANSAGVWKECPKPGMVLGLDPATMPHTLVRNTDGTFTFGPATWDNRVCGDIEGNPDPSFVGQTIDDVFFHKRRLGLLTKENAVLSEAGGFFNFFRTTMTALLDTDPIDTAAAHSKISFLKHAVPFQDALLLFSTKTQFKLSGNETLTPKTVSIKPLTELSSIPDVAPVVADTNIYFVAETGQWAQLYEYFLDKTLESADSDEVSSHAPSYIPAGVTALAGSPDLDLNVILTDGAATAVYLYKFFWSGNEKMQSAWARWSLPACSKVENFAFDKGYLLLLVRRGNTLFLERMNCEAGQAENFHLDRKVVLDNGSYSSVTGRTTFTLPYTVDANTVAVSATGVELTVVSRSTNSIVVEGDWSGEDVYFGLEFESRYRFSPFYLRDPQSGGKTSKQNGRLQILSLAVTYTRSAYFRVEVTPEGRAKRTYPFTGRVISDPNNVLGALVTDDGRFSVPIMSRSDRVTIDIVSDSWLPCGFTAAEWRGTWNPNTRQQ